MSQFKRKLSAFAAMLALVSISSAAMAVTSSDVIGSTSNAKVIDTNTTRTDINLIGGKAGDVAQIDFKNFNVAKGEHVNYGFSGVSQTMINRVLGGKESQILGKITSSCLNSATCGDVSRNTGKVVLINPAGVMFGKGSTVDLNSFTVSTFDFKNAKNLKDMSDAALTNYQNGVLNKLSPTKAVNGITDPTDVYGYITFDSNYTEALDAGLKSQGVSEGIAKFAGKTKVTLNGTHFDRFTDDTNSKVANVNTNKTVNIVSDNVEYKDSLIRVGDNFNYTYKSSKTGENVSTSSGNVRIITADGVTFRYAANGYSTSKRESDGSITPDYAIAKDATGKNVVRTITMENSNKDAIDAGHVAIINRSNAAGSTIKVKDSLIKANKMVNGENGIVIIKGDDDIEIANSRIDTFNTSVTTKDGTTYDTLNKDDAGKVIINANKNLKVSDSVITTAGSKKAGADDALVSLTSIKGTSDVKDTKVLSNGRVEVLAYSKNDIDNSLIYAKNNLAEGAKKNILIKGGKIGDDSDVVNINDSVVDASGNVDIYSRYSSGNTAGDINITSTPKNGENQTLIIAGDDLSIEGRNTKIDNSSLAYKNIKFYNKNTNGINNVTVKNDSTFTQVGSDGKTGTGNVILETNGNFTMDKATMRTAEVGYNTAADDKTAGAFDFTVHVSPVTAKNVDITSTEGNVTVQNASDIKATNDITLTSNKKNVTVKDSKLTANNNINANAAQNADIDNSTLLANNDVNVTAAGGALYVQNSPKINAGNDINLTSYESIKFGNDDDNTANIEKSSDIQAGRNITVKSTAGNITGEKTETTDLKYGNRLTFDAKKNNIFTSKNSLKSVNVDYVAGEGNKFYTTDDIQFVNSSLKSPNNFVESGKDVILNKLEIKNATTNPEDTKTQIFANGNVTTKDITGTAQSDVNATVKNFPQSVSTNRKENPGDTVLTVNQTKLTVQTDTVKDPKNPDNGTISLLVEKADNDKAGLELKAQNVTALDKDPTGGDFRTGYYKSGDPKWDENIDPKEGPEVHLDAYDNKVAIKEIYTDKLTLDKGDKFIADTTDPSKKPVITVNDQGGFNLDDGMGYEKDPQGFTYEQHTDRITETTPENPKTTFPDWKDDDWKLIRTYEEDGIIHNVYERTRDGQTEQQIVKTTDTTHEIKFDNNGDPQDFTLVYKKTEEKTIPGKTITAEEVRNDDSKLPPDTKRDDFIQEEDRTCDPAPEVDPVYDNYDSYIDQVTLPREQVEVSKTSTVADGTADQTSSIMSAAAKIDIAEGDAGIMDADSDDDKELN